VDEEEKSIDHDNFSLKSKLLNEPSINHQKNHLQAHHSCQIIEVKSEHISRSSEDTTKLQTTSSSASSSLHQSSTLPNRSMKSKNKDLVEVEVDQQQIIQSPTWLKQNHNQVRNASIYATLQRPKNAAKQTIFRYIDESSNKNLSYIDFLPARSLVNGVGISVSTYDPFYTCVKQCNDWLLENRNVDVIKCESIRHRFDHYHRINPESTSTDDRSYVIGLRVWVSKLATSRDDVITIDYCNILPEYHNKNRKWKSKDSPRFLPLRDVINNWNRSDGTMKGEVINVENVLLNYAAIHRNSTGEIDADATYVCLDFQGRCNVLITRLFFLQDPSKCSKVGQKIQLSYKDFIPAPLSLPPAATEFQSYEKLLVNLNRWLKQAQLTNIVGLQSIEIPFHSKTLVHKKGKIESDSCSFEAVRSSVHWNTLRCIRVWYCTYGPIRTRCMLPLAQNTQKREISVMMKCFIPYQLTTSGCCGMRKAIFETSRDLWRRAENWLQISNVDVLFVETDNVEKWTNSNVPRDKITSRTYNKEDFIAAWAQSSMEYRFTVIRIFYDANSLKNKNLHVSNPPPPIPAKPCCCFIGCSII